MADTTSRKVVADIIQTTVASMTKEGLDHTTSTVYLLAARVIKKFFEAIEKIPGADSLGTASIAVGTGHAIAHGIGAILPGTITAPTRKQIVNLIENTLTGAFIGTLDQIRSMPVEEIARKLEAAESAKTGTGKAAKTAAPTDDESDIEWMLPLAVAAKVAHKPQKRDGKVVRVNGIPVALCEVYRNLVKTHPDSSMDVALMSDTEYVDAVNRSSVDPCPECDTDRFLDWVHGKALTAASKADAARDHRHEKKPEDPHAKGKQFLHDLKERHYGAYRMMVAATRSPRGFVDRVLQNDLNGDMMREGMDPDPIIALYHELLGRGLLRVMTPAEYAAWVNSEDRRRWLRGGSESWGSWIKRMNPFAGTTSPATPATPARRRAHPPGDVTPEQMVYDIHPDGVTHLLDTIDFLGPGEQSWWTASLLGARRGWRSISRRPWIIALVVVFLVAVAYAVWTLVCMLGLQVFAVYEIVRNAFGFDSIEEGLKALVDGLMPSEKKVQPTRESMALLVKLAYFTLVLSWGFRAAHSTMDWWRGTVDEKGGFIQTGRAMVGILLATGVLLLFMVVARIFNFVNGTTMVGWQEEAVFLLQMVAHIVLLFGVGVPILLRYSSLHGYAKQVTLDSNLSMNRIALWLPWAALAGLALIQLYATDSAWAVMSGNWMFTGVVVIFVVTLALLYMLRDSSDHGKITVAQIAVAVMAVTLLSMLAFGGFTPTWEETSKAGEPIAKTEPVKEPQQLAERKLKSVEPGFDLEAACKKATPRAKRVLRCP